MLPVLLLLLSAAPGPPKVLIVERSTIGLGAAEAKDLRGRVALALDRASVPAEMADTRCRDRACLTALAKEKSACVVGVTLVKNRKGLTVDAEAVDATTVLVQETFLISSGALEDSPEAQVFAHHLAAKLLKDRPVAETPVERPATVARALEPPATEPHPELTQTPPSPLAPKVVFGVSSGVGAVGIGLLIAGAVVKGQLDGALLEQPVVTSLTRAQAEQQAALANGLFAAGWTALGLGLAGSLTALIMTLSADEGPFY
ncbi:MAG: hypothetical protein AB1938_28145 [Myxococcota bacterium]